MFGYVKPRVGELLVKEHELYKAAYCGICVEGGKTVSRLTRLLLNDDFVFLCLLRMAVIGSKPVVEKRRCPFRLSKRNVLVGDESITYSCAAFAVLTYEKCIDDINDSVGFKRLGKKIALIYFKAMARRAKKLYPSLQTLVERHLSRLCELEKSGNASIDAAAEPFATLAAELCESGTSGAKQRILHECGYHLGRYIYLIDAFEDCTADEKSGQFNCLNNQFGGAEGVILASDAVKTTLRDSMNAFSRAFELAENSGYNSLILNIALLGSDDAFERVKGKIK